MVRKALLEIIKALGVAGITVSLLLGCSETDNVTLPEEELSPTEGMKLSPAGLKEPEEVTVAAAPLDLGPRMVPDPDNPGRYETPPQRTPSQPAASKPARKTVDVTARFTDTVFSSKQFKDLKELVDFLERNYGKNGVKIRRLTVLDHSGTAGFVSFGEDLWTEWGKSSEASEHLRRLARLLSSDGEVILWQCNVGRTKNPQEKRAVQASLGSLARLLGVPVWAPRSAVPDVLPAIEGVTVSGWTVVYPNGRMKQTGSDGPSPYERLKTGEKGGKGKEKDKPQKCPGQPRK
ncbi:MAG: hypothetical protein KatS3mg115_2444 [Candidatus Poribacteria bacterium]|nr:MAG: hypothetical protein KatS3mg115_2444 [Candidatus Poribacteria bacterium]